MSVATMRFEWNMFLSWRMGPNKKAVLRGGERREEDESEARRGAEVARARSATRATPALSRAAPRT